MPLSALNYRGPLTACVVSVLLTLSGCQLVSSSGSSCESEGLPLLKNSDCSLHSWMAFAMTAQRADQKWRDRIERQAPSSSLQDRLVRAVALGWSSDQQELVQAQRLYQSGVSDSPQRLRSFFSLLQVDAEQRAEHMKLIRSHAALSAAHKDSSSQSARIEQLERENTDLKRKINELAAIESQWDRERGQR
ncbi:hypothetical protein [Carnimonas nigrificans]|uniref:hypothetical protein n=1 Tax=Carnimonas nigrificans TaxID=64323 RepID=UPI000472B679|nr:hypothetical protein [Carnimonas nigrificans]